MQVNYGSLIDRLIETNSGRKEKQKNAEREIFESKSQDGIADVGRRVWEFGEPLRKWLLECETKGLPCSVE